MTQNYVIDGTRLAGADLRTHRNRLVALNAASRIVLASAGAPAFGVLANSPREDEPASVVVFGVATATFAQSLPAGTLFACDGQGRVVAATGARTNTADAGAASDALIGPHILGMTLVARQDGESGPVWLQPLGAVAEIVPPAPPPGAKSITQDHTTAWAPARKLPER